MSPMPSEQDKEKRTNSLWWWWQFSLWTLLGGIALFVVVAVSLPPSHPILAFLGVSVFHHQEEATIWESIAVVAFLSALLAFFIWRRTH